MPELGEGKERRQAAEPTIGIDMGVKQRLTFSTGETISSRQMDRAKEENLRRAISRSKAE